jgi:hypothetical protein
MVEVGEFPVPGLVYWIRWDVKDTVTPQRAGWAMFLRSDACGKVWALLGEQLEGTCGPNAIPEIINETEVGPLWVFRTDEGHARSLWNAFMPAPVGASFAPLTRGDS